MRNVLVFAMLLVLPVAAMAQTTTTAASTSASCAIATTASAPAKGDLEPAGFPAAGVAMSLPKGFVRLPNSTETVVFYAAKLRGEQPALSVKLSAFPADTSTTLEVFSDKVQPGREDLAVRSYKVLSSRKIKIAGQDGLVRIVTYQFRGVPTTALLMYFLRPLGSGPGSIAYLIAWEADSENSKQLVSLACRVADTLVLSDPVHPYTLPVTELADPIVSQGQGYKFSPPKGWKVETGGNMTAVNTYEYDYLMRQRMPQISFSLSTEPKSPDVLARDGFKEIQDSIDKEKSSLEMLREGPVKVGGVDGYEFAAKNVDKAAKSDSTSVIYVVGRYVTVNNRSYRLIALCPGDSEQTLVAIMDKICDKLEFTVPTAAEPTPPGRGATEKPSPETEPASQPASAPHPALPGAAEGMPSAAPTPFNLPGMN